METTWEGFTAGAFEGYAPGHVHELSDGSRRRQEDRTCESVYRERARAKRLRGVTCLATAIPGLIGGIEGARGEDLHVSTNLWFLRFSEFWVSC
jgi:hypothetical protein